VIKVELYPVKADDDAENEIAESLEEVRGRLVEEIEGKALQCRNWTRSVRRRFKEKVERLRAIDVNLADV
jgi:ribosome recycling factor